MKLKTFDYSLNILIFRCVVFVSLLYLINSMQKQNTSFQSCKHISQKSFLFLIFHNPDQQDEHIENMDLIRIVFRIIFCYDK